MAIAVVQNKSVDAGITSSAAVALNSAVTAGNSLIVAVAWPGSPSPPPASVSDNQGNTYTLIGNTTSHFRLYIYWCASAAAGSTTITATLSSSTTGFDRLLLAAIECSDIGSLQTFTTNGNFSSTWSVPAIDVDAADSLALCWTDAARTSATPSGATQELVEGRNGGFLYAFTKTVPTGSTNFSASIGVNTSWNAVFAVFAPAGGQSPVPIIMQALH